MRAGDLLERLERGVLVWTILGLAVVGCIQVFTRYVLNYSFTWYDELGRYLVVFVTFLGAAIGVKRTGHFTMDLVVKKLPCPYQQFLRLTNAAISAVFFLLVIWFSWKTVRRLHGFGTTSPTLGIPLYIAYLPIPFFSLVMLLRYCRIGIDALREIPLARRRGERR